MRVPIEVFLGICIFPIILGSPLGFKNKNEDGPDLKSTHIRAKLFPPRGIHPSGPLPHGLLYRERPKDRPDEFRNRRTTTNKSEAVGVTEIYMPKSRYLSRGYKPVYIYYVTDPPEQESSSQATADDYENTENKELSSNSHQEDKTKSRSSLEVGRFEDELTIQEQKSSHLEGDGLTKVDQEKSTPLNEKSNSESDYDDSEEGDDEEESEYEYEDDSEYVDGPEDEYPNTDSALSATNEAQHPGHDNRVCAHYRGNQNPGFPGHYPKPGHPSQYPNQDYQGQFNARSRGYPTNTGYQGYYPSTGNQGYYPDHTHQGHLPNAGNQEYNRGHQGHYPYHGYQGPPPNRGYQGPHLENNQSPYRGYQGPHPYRGYQGPHLDNNQGPNPYRGYQGQHPYRGYQGPHLDQGPYRGYQGPHPYRGYQGPHLDSNQGPYPYRGYQGPHPDHRGSHPISGHHGNYLNQNEVDPNCDHGNTNLGRDSNEPEAFVGSGIDDADLGEEYENFSGGNSEYSDAEYYEDDSEYDDESEDSSDKPEVPSQSDITFESNEELSNDGEKTPANDISGKTDDLLNSDYLNDESLHPESNTPNELKRENESSDKSEDGDSKVIKKCIKSIQNEENLSKNFTDATLLADCISETMENSEGNKSGRLLDIFTRTNFSMECTTPKNESGQCKSFSECPILNMMNNYNQFLQYMCLRGVFVGVCCPDNPVVEISDSDDNNTTEVSLDIQQPSEGCGLAQKTRIVGGTISAPHEWTWMVALMRRNRFFCGGVIINNWYVLTAAHCVLGVNVKDLKVRLGEYNFMERTDHQHDIDVAEIKRHAMFVTATFQHDIALLKLKRRVEYSKFIGSICLPETNARSYSDDKATVVGWGTVSFGGAASPILRQVTVPVWDNEDCDRTYFLERIDDSFLCAGSTENGEDACQGDSGGPLMTLNSDNRWEVIGIVSWGRRCGDPTYPGVYTRVTSYLDWIAAHAK